MCLEISTQGRSPLLSVKISLFDVFKQLLTLHKLTPTSDATSRLHGICNGSINRMEDGEYTLQPSALGLGISAPPPPTPNFRVFVWDWEGAKKCFIFRDQTTRDLTFTSPGHTHSPVCAPTASFSVSRVVISG